MHKRTALGFHGEQLVAEYLEKQNFSVIAKNFRNRDGEVDVIARKGSLTVFVEVKTRNDLQIDPTEVITPAKQRKIARTAAVFMAQESTDIQHGEYDCRFDVAIVTFNAEQPNITYIADAFQVDEYA